MKKILIADDNSSILELLAYHFQKNDFEVRQVDNGQAAYELASAEKFDLLLLDLMMPILSGIDVTQKLRKEKNYTPILILTAREDEDMRLSGLMDGADDYMDKTTSMQEVVIRAKTLIRRSQVYLIGDAHENEKKVEKISQFGELEINRSSKFVKLSGQKLDLTKREFELLDYLIQQEGEISSREDLLAYFWGVSEGTETRTIDVLISKIRKKLNNKYIKTKRGFGYYFDENEI